MTANSILVPNNWRFNLANLISQSIANSYYLFVADHTEHTNSALQPLSDKISTTLVDVYRNMIQGKIVGNTDVSLMIRNIPWESRVFDMYDDQIDLTTKDFYAVVNASSYYHVFKCLDNNQGNTSTVEPNFADISGANTRFYATSDGYVWKYMYTVPNSTVGKFGTSSYFPVQANTVVSNAAIAGAIEVINIDDPGFRYDNYVTGTFATDDLRINGNPHLYKISNNTTSTVNGFYTGCLIYLSDGDGVGQYSIIDDYFSNSNGNFIDLADSFDVLPMNGTAFEIYPNVKITGSGAETINAVARALINATASNSVYKVEILNEGKNYNYATAEIVANSVVTTTKTCELRPIYSPNKGHGFNAAEELLSNRLEISVKLSNSESNTILTSNKFQQVGIIKNPLFANVVFNINNSFGSFLSGETIHKIKTAFVCDSAVLDVTNNEVTAANGQFTSKFQVGDFVYLTLANSEFNQLGIVNSITNSSVLSLTTNAFFTSNETQIFTITCLANATLRDIISVDTLELTNVYPKFSANDFIIGESSGGIATINSISRNDVTKGFQTFIQLYKYSGLLSSGVFEPNELVYQGNTITANALLHTALVDGNNNITIYTSNQIGRFVSSLSVIGNTSGAVASVDNLYDPEIVFGSGDVIYLENITSVTRQEDQTETFKISFAL